ncbi:MAG: 3'-5' exonuclease [Bacteroidia bacterium]|nr:3'-5' exonuclease [Bacteroidia bacterium]
MYKLEHVLFLDIETVPQAPSYDALSEAGQDLWRHKAQVLLKDTDTKPADIYNRAGIYAEFGKIVCVSVGMFMPNAGGRLFRLKSFFGHNEAELLTNFAQLLHKFFNKPQHYLCAHNGKEFDFPFLSRRLLINGIALPELLNTAGKKPWEVNHLDSMELWKFGDYKSYTPLNLLAHVFDIASPKDDIDGGMVWQVYWQQNDLARIVTYCQKDVVTVAQIMLRYNQQPLLKNSEITIADS